MLVLISLFAVVAVSYAFYDHTDAVTDLDDSNFASEIFGSPDLWMVEFYAPWCGHCRNLAPAYLKAAENVKGLAKVGAVNCDEDKNKQICGSYGIQGFPTLKLFAPDADPSRGASAATDYQGPRSAAGIAKAILGALPNKVTKIAAEKTKDKFFNQDLDKAILFTDKSTVSNLYKSLAVHFAGRLVFGQVQISKMSDLAEEYGVSSSPTLLVVKADSEDPVKYDGKMQPTALRSFLEEHAGPAPENKYAKKSAKKSGPPPPPAPPPQDAVWELRTTAQLKEQCLERAGICAIALLDSYAAEDERKAQLAVLDELLESHGGHKGGFTITHLDPLDQENWMKPFGFGQLAASDLPRLMILNQKKGDTLFNAYVGAFTSKQIGSYLSSVKRGGVKVQKLDKGNDLLASFTDLKTEL